MSEHEPRFGDGREEYHLDWLIKQRDTMASRFKHTPAKSKVAKVMREFKGGDLHSGSKKGPVVQNRRQAVAIALNEARRGKRKGK